MTTSLGSRWELFFDVVAAATAVGVPVSMLATGRAWSLDDGFALLILIAAAGLVVLRRRLPRTAGTGAVILSGLVLVFPTNALAVWVLAEIVLFSLALRSSLRWTLGIGGTHAALLYLGAIVAFHSAPYDPVALILPVWTGAVVAFAIALRTQQDYVTAIEDRARTAAAARETELQRHLGEERMRIARDLHDSVTNSLTVINLQASSAQRHLRDESARSEEALQIVREVSHRTVAELAGILTVLRDHTSVEDHSLPTAANIPHLIELFKTAGGIIDVDLTSPSDAEITPAGSAALYRITQEALTNARRHGEAPVSLRGGVSSEMAWIELRNRTTEAPHPLPSSGFGIVGMKERAELAGGMLRAGVIGMEFVVRVEVPTGERHSS